ncbi:hypothetical protein CGRA01v4_13218 [Colletotrichum graminicola]|nr:hypothetical protein CGRA01v4_13218 [Colletotrichum graminicola]
MWPYRLPRYQVVLFHGQRVQRTETQARYNSMARDMH